MPSNPYSILLANGNLYLDFPIYQTYFKSIDHVMLVSKPPLVLLMPIRHAGAGGLLLKVRNARGDRVVNVIEFLQSCDLDVSFSKMLPVIWNEDYAALTFNLDLIQYGKAPAMPGDFPKFDLT